MAKLVKVIMLKGGTPFGGPGTLAEVVEPVALELTRVRSYHDGSKQVEYRVAKPADEVDAPVNVDTLTAAEMAAAGKKNIVVTPDGAEAVAAKAAADKAEAEKAEAEKAAAEKAAADEAKAAAAKAAAEAKAKPVEAKAEVKAEDKK